MGSTRPTWSVGVTVSALGHGHETRCRRPSSPAVRMERSATLLRASSQQRSLHHGRATATAGATLMPMLKTCVVCGGEFHARKLAAMIDGMPPFKTRRTVAAWRGRRDQVGSVAICLTATALAAAPPSRRRRASRGSRTRWHPSSSKYPLRAQLSQGLPCPSALSPPKS